MRLMIFISLVLIFVTKSDAQDNANHKKATLFCDTISTEALLYTPDTFLYKKQLLFADKNICTDIKLSTYKSPNYFAKRKKNILLNSYFNAEENITSFYFTNISNSECCQVVVKGNLEKDYKGLYIQPRRIRVFKGNTVNLKTIRTDYKNFNTENGIKIGLSIREFFRIKDGSIFKKDVDTLRNTITYYYNIQVFCKKEADWLFGKLYYGAGYPIYYCNYTFDLKTKKLIEFEISM